MIRAALMTTVVLVSSLSLPSPRPAGAAPSDDCPLKDFCVSDEVDVPGTTATPAASGDRDQPGGGGGTGPVCAWEQSGVAGPAGQADGGPFLDVAGAPSPGAEFYAEVCDGTYTGRVRWIAADTPATAAPPAPEMLAAAVRVRLEGSLPAPTVESTPAPGVAAFVGYPSFVSVTNWTGVVRDGECDPSGLLCVSVTATPSLRFSPGEPDAPVKECAGPGVPFDPTGDPFEQAASPGACAYPYRLRTGVDSRPDAWPGVVMVVWDLAWSSTSGAGGSLEPVQKSAAVPRTVDEAQTVVVSAGE